MALAYTENGKYRIEFLSAATFPGAIQVMRDSFFQEETMAVGLGVNKNPKALEEVLEICADTALDGVSLVAVAVDSGEVVGACFNKIVTSDSSETSFYEIFVAERCTQTETQNLTKCLIEMEDKINFLERYNVNCLFEIMILGTDSKHRYNGLGLLLSQKSIEVAKNLNTGLLKMSELDLLTVDELGPKYSFLSPRKPVVKKPELITSIFTAAGSKKIGKALNFNVDLRVPLSELTNGDLIDKKIGYKCYLEACSIKIYDSYYYLFI